MLLHDGIFTGNQFNNSKRADDEERMSLLHYDVIIMSLPLKSPSGGEAAPEERDITSLYHTKINRFQHFIQDLLQLRKRTLTHPVYQLVLFQN